MTTTLFKGIDIGTVPSTPTSLATVPALRHYKLFEYAKHFGKPFGYIQEQGGELVQNIFPIQTTESAQISTSSKVNLALHTETAFHPCRPEHVLLLCLRGDKTAFTTYADLSDILQGLTDKTINTLKNKWFRTRVDESFRTKGEPDAKFDIAILSDNGTGLEIRYDRDFMQGLWGDACDALEELNTVIEANTKEVSLEAGDLLVIDNKTTVHGRKPFKPAYDGADRWVQRMLVRRDIPSHVEHQTCPFTGHNIIIMNIK